MMAVLLVRHAIARRRRDWSKPDSLRPLTRKGRAQASALGDLLQPFAIERIWSSPFRRCVETVEPLAALLGLAIQPVDELAEGSGASAAAMVALAPATNIVLCTHGDVIPELFEALTQGPIQKHAKFSLAKGSTWLIDDGGLKARYLPPPDAKCLPDQR